MLRRERESRGGWKPEKGWTEGSVAGKRGREPNIPVAVVVVRWKSRWWRPPVWLIFYYPTPEPPTPTPIRFTPRATIIPCRFFLVAWPMAAEKRKREARKQGGKAWGGEREGEIRGNVAEGLRSARWKRPEIFSSPLLSPRWCRMHRWSKELSFATSVTDVTQATRSFLFLFFFFSFFGARNKLKFDRSILRFL